MLRSALYEAANNLLVRVNHVHIIAVPHNADALGKTFRHVHRHYTGYVNARMRGTGHPWQGRFTSVAIDDQHLLAELRYAALNPVRAQLVARAEDWSWSSARTHIAGVNDHVVKAAPALERIGDFRTFLGEDFNEAFTNAALRHAETIGRPVESREKLEDMESRTGLALLTGKRGPKSTSNWGFTHL